MDINIHVSSPVELLGWLVIFGVGGMVVLVLLGLLYLKFF